MSCNPSIPDQNNTLLGVVLCGGASSRMGSDKGLLSKSGQTWAEIAFEKLQLIGLPVVVSINEKQYQSYQKIFAKEDLIEDCININGPLKGILSVYNKYPQYDLIVLGCDIIDIEYKTLDNLKKLYEEKEGEHDFFVFSRGKELEPLVGIYTAEGLNKIFALSVSHQLQKTSVKYALEISNTFVQELEQDKWEEFKNYNEKTDLEK